MRNPFPIVLSLLALFLATAENCSAKTAPLSAPMGTLGLGMELMPIAGTLNFRTGSTALNYSGKSAENIFFFHEEQRLNNSAIADYHPWTNGFRLSAGLFYDDETWLKQSPNSNILPFSRESEQQSVAPYFGLGWGVAPFSKNRWMFTFDVGLVYQGQDAALSDQCGQSPSSEQCLGSSNAQPNEMELQYALERYGLSPLLSAGITFKF